MKKTAMQMVAEIRECNSQFVTYGSSDIGTPVPLEEAIADILSMDDDLIGDGTWYACDAKGVIKE